jgi:EF hand
MLKNTKLVIALSLSALVASAGLAGAGVRHAGPGGESPRAYHQELKQKFDANRDGKLDDSERAALHEAMQARRAEHRQKVLAQFDANRDGKLDDAEKNRMFDQRAAEHFRKLDRDGNGVITVQELKANMMEHKQLRLEGRKAGRALRGHGGPAGRQP